MTLASTRSSVWATHHGDFTMFFANDLRSSAAALAGAFVTAMLFVSAAIGPIPLA
jgi:hypothetical protein